MKKKTVRVRLGTKLGEEGSLPLPVGTVVDGQVHTVLTPESDPVEVVLDRYIRRRIAQGDLIVVGDGGLPVVTMDADASKTQRHRMPLPPAPKKGEE